jgi:3-dehydroquinate dehydratase/shikimate dehydrogenase
MSNSSLIKTERIILRPWEEKDLEPFAKMNADPRVMEYYPSVKSFEESADEYHRILEHFSKHGWGLWAVSLNEIDFIGYIGLRFDNFQAHFTPAVEIGWRLAFDYWGKGYATEGALASLNYGFTTLHLNEIISFTSFLNTRSQGVMKKIGMHHNPADDFDHPKLPTEHRLQKHTLYRITRDEWVQSQHACACKGQLLKPNEFLDHGI